MNPECDTFYKTTGLDSVEMSGSWKKMKVCGPNATSTFIT